MKEEIEELKRVSYEFGARHYHLFLLEHPDTPIAMKLHMVNTWREYYGQAFQTIMRAPNKAYHGDHTSPSGLIREGGDLQS